MCARAASWGAYQEIAAALRDRIARGGPCRCDNTAVRDDALCSVRGSS